MKYVIYKEKQCHHCNGEGKTLTKDWNIVYEQTVRLMNGIKFNQGFAYLSGYLSDINEKVQFSAKEGLTQTTEDCALCEGRGYLHIAVPLTAKIIAEISADNLSLIPDDSEENY